MRPLAALLLLLILPAAAPAVDLACLGAGGGDLESDCTCFALRPGPSGPYTLLVDGGSLAEGAAALARQAGTLKPPEDPQARAEALADLLHPVEGILLTHTHLDHVAGFTVAQTALLTLGRTRRKPAFRVIGSPETLSDLAAALYGGPVWGSFYGDPAGGAVMTEEPLALTGEVRIGGFRVRRFDVDHKVPTSAYLLENGSGECFLHLGDTGPLPEAFWAPFRALLAAGRLKGVALECSFPSADHGLAESTLHLTPDTLLLELAKLAGADAPPGGLPLDPGRAETLARAVAERLPCGVLAMHVKPFGYRTVTAELDRLRKAGIRLVVAERGVCYSY